jgi:S1-C subfamily serine protease
MGGGGADTRAPVGHPRCMRILRSLLAALAAAAVAAGVSFASQTPSNVGIGPVGLALQSTFVKVVQRVSPTVVQIEDRQGLGSGIVLDTAGDIVTNSHVVGGETSFTVTTSSGKIFPAVLVGSFPPDDLAVVRVSGAHLKPAVFADSSKLQVGDLAIAIGNPLGLRSSVTEGIVSAFRQAVQENKTVTLPSVIQTSAAINPGNSGGALIDIEGRVIGIPTLAATDPQLGGGSAPGIGFAIPSNLVTDIAGQILKNGRVVDSHRASLGVSVGDTNGNGVIVGAVTAGGPCAKAGIAVGDVIVAVAGHATPTVDVLSSVLARLKPAEKVSVIAKHANGTKTTYTAVLATLSAG